ncbi:MAG: hypothetical protein WCJ30_22615 [Deltaproteobacteria bacterium]
MAETKGTRAEKCRSCGADVSVPLDLSAHTFVCPGCGKTERVNAYISDTERLGLDQARQIAGSQARAELHADGVPCGKCGAHNVVPDDGSAEVVCHSCGATVLLSDHGDAAAVARARLKRGVIEMRAAIKLVQVEREKSVRTLLFLVVVIVVGVFVALGITTRGAH